MGRLCCFLGIRLSLGEVLQAISLVIFCRIAVRVPSGVIVIKIGVRRVLAEISYVPSLAPVMGFVRILQELARARSQVQELEGLVGSGDD